METILYIYKKKTNSMKLNNFYINEKINNSFLENYNIKKTIVERSLNSS